MKKCCILITAVCAIITLSSCSNMLEDLRKAKNKRNVEIVIKTASDDSKKTNKVKIIVDSGDKEIEKTGYVFSKPDAQKDWKNAEKVLKDVSFKEITEDSDGKYIIYATEDGDYTVAVKDKNGNSTYKTVTVDNIIPVDVNIPEVSSNKKGESFTVTVKGLNIAAEDFDENAFTVTCRDSSGNEVTEVTQGAKVTRNDNGSISVVLTIPEQTGEYDVTMECSTKEYGEVCLAGTLKVGNYNIYSVKFDTDGGNKVDAQIVKEDGKAVKPENPKKTAKKTSFVFLGWYNGEAAYDFSTAVKADITLKAKWLEGFVNVEGSKVVGDEKFIYSDAPGWTGVFRKERTVEIGDFYMCDHEVTQGEYEEYCLYLNDKYSPSSYGRGNDYPAYYVSWYDAVIYCNLRSKKEGLKPAYYFAEADGTEIQDGREISVWRNRLGDSIINMEKTGNVEKYCFAENFNELNRLDYSGDKDKDGGENGGICFDQKANGYRLPTEAEWEYAARGGKEGVNKDNPDDWAGTNIESDLKYYAWYVNNSGKKTHIVKSDKDIDTDSANTLGLYDMSGNVMEWCWDWYNDDVTKGDKKDRNGVVANPCGASSGSFRVCRGGSWYGSASNCRAANRDYYSPYDRSSGFGFRLVRSAQ